MKFRQCWKWIVLGLTFLVITVSCKMILKRSDTPFIVIGILYAGFFGVLCASAKSTGRVMAWNITAILLILTAFETIYALKAHRESLRQAVSAPPMAGRPAALPSGKQTTYTLGSYTNPYLYFKDDFLLGYSPRKGASVTSKRMLGHEVIYDVRYTIGENGLRLGADKAPAKTPAIVFFGDSLTFGEGVNDAETFAYRLENDSQGKFKTYNFGFHGYGAHQMLAWLESGKEQPLLEGHKPIAGVYLAIPDHVKRSAGRSSWDVMGPRFQFKDGRLTKKPGHLFNFVKAKMARKLNSSYLWSRKLSKWLDRPVPVAEASNDLDLYAAIIGRCKELFESRHGGRFIMILWSDDRDSSLATILRARVATAGIPVIPIVQILPDFNADPDRFALRDGGHPTPLAHQKIASYLLNYFDRLARDAPDSGGPRDF